MLSHGRLSRPYVAPSLAQGNRPLKKTHSTHLPVMSRPSISGPLIHMSRHVSFPHHTRPPSWRHVVPFSPPHRTPIAGCAAMGDYGRASSGAGVAAIGPRRRARTQGASRCWRIIGGPRRCCTGEMHAPLPTSAPASSSTMTSVHSSAAR